MSKIIRALGIKRKISEFSKDHGTFVVNVEDYQNVCDQKDSMLEALIDVTKLQEDNYVSGMNTHLALSDLAEKLKEVIEKATNKTWNEIKELIQKV